MLTPIRDETELAAALRESAAHPVLLFKHSTRCGISARAKMEVDRFAQEMPDADCRLVLVVEQRPLAQAIAQQTGIPHQSPQALLLRRGAVIWHAAHYAITAAELREQFDAAGR